MDEETLEQYVDTMRLEKQAKLRYMLELPKARILARRYEDWHAMYAPVRGDQWPQDRTERPNKLHITDNIIQAFIDTESRILSILPKISNQPDSPEPEIRQRAELTEKTMMRYLEMSGWDVWMFTWHQIKAIYGKAILKPFWNLDTNAPDVELVEQPQNVIIGYGDSNFNSIDWVIYRQTISTLQAKLRYPDAPDEAFKPSPELQFAPSSQDHSDPLEQLSPSKNARPLGGTGYEAGQIELWDYWYIDADSGTVTNCTMLNGHLVDGPHPHPEYPGIPYIISEWAHEPGYPDGHGMVELLFDIQMGLNRALSHLAQYVWDNTDPAWQLVGTQAPMAVPDGIVPAAGEIVAPGPDTRIEPIQGGVNQFPIVDLIRIYWENAHKITGLPEVLFGGLPGSQTSGRAVAVQIEAAANRIDPRRRRSYDALRQLLQFWYQMIQKLKPTVQTVNIADIMKGLDRWMIIAPEITPRDIAEHTTNIINQLNAKLISLETAMDQIGVDAPLEEMQRIATESSNAAIFPDRAQQKAAVLATMLSLGQQASAMGISGFGPEQGAGMQQNAQAMQQGMQPTAFEDQNQPAPQPFPGGPPPAGATPPGGGLGAQFEPLVRQTGSGELQSLSQIVLPKRQV